MQTNWPQIITALVVPFLSAMTGAFVAFRLTRAEQHRRSTQDLFYRLKQHTDDFKYSVYDLISLPLRQKSLLTILEFVNVTPEGFAEVLNKDTTERNRIIAQARLTLSTLSADKAFLLMHFQYMLARPLSQAIDDLAELATVFLPDQAGGKTPEYEAVKNLPVDARAAEVHKQIEMLWANTYTLY